MPIRETLVADNALLLDKIAALGGSETGRGVQAAIGQAVNQTLGTGVPPRLVFTEDMINHVSKTTGDAAWLAPDSPLWSRGCAETIQQHYDKKGAFKRHIDVAV